MAFPFACGDCWFSRAVEDEAGKYIKTECRVRAPDTHLLSYPVQGVAGTSLQVQVMSVWPQVDPLTGWCGEGEKASDAETSH